MYALRVRVVGVIMVGYLRLFSEHKNMYEILSIPDINFNLTFLVPKSTKCIKGIVSYKDGLITTNTEYSDSGIEEEYTDIESIMKELGLDFSIIDELIEIKLNRGYQVVI